MSSILTNLPQLTAATNSDWLYIVDVSDTTDNPAGSSKKILRGDLYSQITGFTYLDNTITLSLSDNSTYAVTINTMTGLTINGDIVITGQTTSGSISATTYYNLPLDVYTTGGTYDNGTIIFTNNSGGTYSVTGLVTGDTYWTSGSTGNFSIKAKNDSGLDATGDYAVAEGYGTIASGYGSHAEGIYTQAIGNGSHSEGGYYDGIDYISGGTAIGHGSHAEGRRTIAGWKSFTVDSVVNGLVTINASYGDITTEFVGYKVILDTNIYTYNTVTFSSTTNTEILLNDLSVNSGSYVADIDNLNSPYGDISDNGVNSHAEGSQTKSLGYYSHAEGQATIASGNYGSHAEGQ